MSGNIIHITYVRPNNASVITTKVMMSD